MVLRPRLLLTFLSILLYFRHCSSFRNSLHLNPFSRHTSSLHLTIRNAADVHEPSVIISDLKVGIVGGGPSGLLLAHNLCKMGCQKVSVFEGRGPPQSIEAGKAYALGIGQRGRTAIKRTDDELWEAVAKAGFASQRFQLYAGPFKLTLRDEKPNKNLQQEPSVLLYQSDLCRVLADELLKKYAVSVQYNCEIERVDLERKCLVETSQGGIHDFDLVVGADGVNSVVRQAMNQVHPAMDAKVDKIPGIFKVVSMPSMPPTLDPTAVSLVLPRQGGVTAFVEPTVGETCCILFAGRNASDILLSSTETNVEEIANSLKERFPLLFGQEEHGDDNSYLMEAARQLSVTFTSQASKVVCQTYHYLDSAVLIGDAAHATGGVSGQGVNSALADSLALAQELGTLESTQSAPLQKALLAYSQRQVPEGRALYDLSFPDKPKSTLKRFRGLARTLVDFLFKGKWGIGDVPLQTLLTTSNESFSSIRQKRASYYEEEFPSLEAWNERLRKIDAQVESVTRSTKVN